MRETDETAVESLPWLPLFPWQHDAARAALAQRATWPHALLIHGPRGIGKHALALNLALALLCEAPRVEGLACGRCPGCRYAIAGQHPDLLRLELLVIGEGDGTLKTVDTITIDRVRALTEFAQLSSHRHRAKVAVIAPAERMNVAAANALLKTLEEPPPGTYVMLVCEQPGRLPPTIVSRCRKLPAPRPETDVARNWLVAQGVAEPDLALAQAGGAPLLALGAVERQLALERRVWIEALGDPDRLAPVALAARIDSAARDERRARLAHAVDWLAAWTADLARVAAGGAARQNRDAEAALERLAKRVAAIRLFRYYRTLLDQRTLLAHPLQPRLVAEALLTHYRSLF
jgi:DNA polymerase III subunit delta'